MAKRFNEAVNIARQNFSTGEVQAKMDLVGRLEQFRAKQHQQNAMEAKERGVKSAAGVKLEKKDIDGQKVTVAPKKKAGNIFGLGEYETQAHNKALQGAYFASLDSDNRNAVADITAKNKDNIAGFNDAIEGYRKGVLAGVDPEARQRVEIDLNGRIDSSRSKVHLATLARQKQESEDIINANAIEAGDAAYRHARNGDDVQAGEEYLRASESIEALDLPVDKKQVAQRELRRELEENFKKNDIRKISAKDGFEAAMAEVERMGQKVPKGWTPDEWERFIDGERADINRQISRQKAAKGKNSKEALAALKDYETASSLGFEISRKETAQVGELVKDKPELQKRFDITQKVKTFSVSSRGDRASILEKLQTGRIADVDEYASAIKADAAINRAAQEDGISLGIKQGLLQDQPLDLSDPASFQARQEQAALMSQHYGVDVSPLKDEEADGLAAQLPTMTTPEKITMAQSLQESPAVWGQLSKKNAGVFAMAGASGDVVLMDAVFKGQELLDAKVVMPIKAGDYINDFNDYTEGVYGAEDQRDILRAAIAHYAQTSDQKDGSYDSSDFEDSLKAVTGGVAEVNGFKLELPRGVDEDDFSDLINDFQPETVDRLGGVNGMTNERAAELIPQGRIRSIGANEYIVELDGGVLFDKQGQPFIINYDEDMAAENKAITTQKGQRSLSVGARQVERLK